MDTILNDWDKETPILVYCHFGVRSMDFATFLTDRGFKKIYSLIGGVDAWAHWLPQLFGGRQFARIWHFGGMIALIGFFGVHLMMVALTGVWNNLRSMITGWFVISQQPQPPQERHTP